MLPELARVDSASDREHGGRYARHVLARAAEFDETWGDISPVGFACVAWRLATVPELDPGYVRLHGRVLTAECLRNRWDGSLTARVGLVSPPPQALAADAVWGRDRGWRGWPETFGQYVAPTQEELSRTPHVRPVLLVDAPLPLAGLPPAPDGPGPELPTLAERAVAVLARELNELLGPMLGALDD